MNNDLDKENSATFLIHEVARLLKRRFEDEARAFGVTLPQWRTLIEINRNAGISQVALSAAIDSDPMTMSGILDRLEKRNLIERFTDPNDSRAKRARLTEAGETLVARARKIGGEMNLTATEGMSAEERARFVATLKIIRNNLSTMTAVEKEAV